VDLVHQRPRSRGWSAPSRCRSGLRGDAASRGRASRSLIAPRSRARAGIADAAWKRGAAPNPQVDFSGPVSGGQQRQADEHAKTARTSPIAHSGARGNRRCPPARSKAVGHAPAARPAPGNAVTRASTGPGALAAAPRLGPSGQPLLLPPRSSGQVGFSVGATRPGRPAPPWAAGQLRWSLGEGMEPRGVVTIRGWSASSGERPGGTARVGAPGGGASGRRPIRGNRPRGVGAGEGQGAARPGASMSGAALAPGPGRVVQQGEQGARGAHSGLIRHRINFCERFRRGPEDAVRSAPTRASCGEAATRRVAATAGPAFTATPGVSPVRPLKQAWPGRVR
jgi:hypothetical protein